MSKYDLVVTFSPFSNISASKLDIALEDIDARLTRLEATQNEMARDLLAVYPGSPKSCGHPSAQPQREPGWYPFFRNHGEADMFWWTGEEWRPNQSSRWGIGRPVGDIGERINDRIQPPEGAV